MSCRAKSTKQNASPCKHNSSDTDLCKFKRRERSKRLKAKKRGRYSFGKTLGYLSVLLFGRTENI